MSILYFNKSDVGNAERLITLKGADIRYCYPFKSWYAWDGKTWARDEGDRMITHAKEVIRKIYEEADKQGDEARKEWIKYALKCENKYSLTSMIELAQPDAKIETGKLDSHRYKISVNNGTVDLKTLTLNPHNKEDYITKIIDIDFIGDGLFGEEFRSDEACPRWTEFLELVFDGNYNIIRFIQRALGICLTGDIGESLFFILYGTGQNGKSTFLNLIMRILKEYSYRLSSSAIMLDPHGNNDRSHQMANLSNKRFVACMEGAEGAQLHESLIKDLTGGDSVEARFLYQEYFTYYPEFKIWFATNHKPEIKGTDEGIWRRICYIPFERNLGEVLKQQGKVKIPNYDNVLYSEKNAIFQWMLEGLRDYYAQGVAIPEEIKHKIKELRDENDSLAEWIDDCCVTGPGIRDDNKALLDSYTSWCAGKRSNSEDVEQLSKKMWATKMDEKGYFKKPQGRTKFRYGIRVMARGEQNVSNTDKIEELV